jgi:hypothetical protein
MSNWEKLIHLANLKSRRHGLSGRKANKTI